MDYARWPLGDQGFSALGSVELISYLFIHINRGLSTSTVMFLVNSAQDTPGFLGKVGMEWPQDFISRQTSVFSD